MIGRSLTRLIFLLLAVATIFYIQVFLKDRYVSTCRFSVVVEDTSNVDLASGIGSLLGGSTVGNSDTQAVIGFIYSADLLLELEKKFKLQEHFDQADNDSLFRLPIPSSLEDRLAYYRERFTANLNVETNLIELNIESFEPQLSYEIAKEVLKRTQGFINTKNQEIAKDRMVFVTKDMERTQEKINEADQALLNFQSKHHLIQPEAIIQAQLAAIQTLKLQKIQKQIELTTLKSSSPNSPMIDSLGVTIQEIDAAIQSQEESLSGDDAEKLNRLLAKYKELTLNLEFAQQLNKGSQILLEDARAETLSNTRFFTLIQQPIIPEEAIHPRRTYWSITSACVVFLIYLIVSSMCKSILDRS